MYDGNVGVAISSSTPPLADIVEIGDGDYSLNFGALGSGEYLNITLSSLQPNDRVSIIFSSSEGLNNGAVVSVDGSLASEAVGDTTAITGSGTAWSVPSSKKGCVTIVVNGSLVARIALYDNNTSVETCLGLALPISARGDGDSELPMTIQGSPAWAGWQSALPAGGVVRMTGFNLPRSLTSYSGATTTTINAQGGDYGIEFTIPQDSTSLAIFDETFWLYIR